MKVRGQAAVLACGNAAVRAMGFVLRVALSRWLGAEALGVMELSHSAHMLSIAPVTAGLPAAVSRLTALRRDDSALRAGRGLALRMSAVLTPLWALAAPAVAWLLGDRRALPALWAFTPCIAALGLAAVYHGYCYGLRLAWPPAVGALAEQALRFGLSFAGLALLPGRGTAGRAAVTGAAEGMAGAAALALVVWLARGRGKRGTADAARRRETLRLALPLTGTRMLQTLSRPLTAAMLPRLLIASGMTAGEAAAGVGMLYGMVMPVLLLPGILTGAVGMVGAPALARRRDAALRGAALRLFAGALGCGLMSWAGVHIAAGLLAERAYHLPELAGLFRAAAPLTLLFALQQAAGTLLTGRGLQRKTLLPAVLGTALTLALMRHWAASPLGLYGAVYAMIVGRAAGVLWELGEAVGAVNN